MTRLLHIILPLIAWLIVTCPAYAHETKEQPLLPQIAPAPMVSALIDDPLNSPTQRTDLLIFHGKWDQLPPTDELTLNQRAKLALLRYQLGDPALVNPETAPLLRAKAALLRGEPQLTLDLLKDQQSAQADLLASQAHEDLGQTTEAVNRLLPWREQLLRKPMRDPVELTAAAEALAALARLQGRPAQDYQLTLNLLAQVREDLDPAYWPALLAEAELLIEKDNTPEGVEALTGALALNSRCSEAWAWLGWLSVRGYSFDRASAVVKKLRDINPDHPLADLIQARSLLQQRDVAGARGVIESALSRFPVHRELLALKAAAYALAYDEKATERALKHLQDLSPGNPLGDFTVGTYLSSARQYAEAEAHLRKAVEYAPNWPTPRIELGLLLMQAAHDEDAQIELAAATRLDPFNKRAANQLDLLNDLLAYERIETEHFLIRYQKGIDEALARDMPLKLEAIYRDITDAFQHEPKRITRIDLMPSEELFAVRITGMPDIWTIAAATGDAIAMTPPREGPGQSGGFDWPNVIRHEFVHTVTLDQTRNRVPHWFTEACAVSQETAPRSYETCRLLADALNNDKLFPLDQINWGFIRPKTPTDRPLAYAQSDWMLEYLAVRYGHDSIVDLLSLYRQGTPDIEALQQVTGTEAEQFMHEFKVWAGKQVQQWGLSTPALGEKMAKVITDQAESIDPATLDELLKENPTHPDLLKLVAERAMQSGDPQAAREAVQRYAGSRPVDPWPYRALAELALTTGNLDDAIEPMQFLDRNAPSSGRWAQELAKTLRTQGDYPGALAAIERALDREPYHAGYRELAAAIALQASDTDRALHHVYAASVIEPDRPQHQVRLAALYSRLDRPEQADAAARRAIAIDPNSPAKRFLKSVD